MLCVIFVACSTSPLAVVPVTQRVVTPLPSRTPTAISTMPPTVLPVKTAASSPPILPSPTTQLLPQWENPLDKTLLETAVSQNVPFQQLSPGNSGVWQYDSGAFLHPIALQRHNNIVYLLDGGRVLTLNLMDASPPQTLLQPGDTVDDLRVQEPLDLALVDGHLLVLDRTGDVYALDLTTAVWQLERYERPIGEASSNYFVALGQDTAGGDRRLLLESSYGYAQYYFPDSQQRIWSLPDDVQPVDLSGVGDLVYLLWANRDGSATAALFQETRRLSQFVPTIVITQPRQIVATETAVYILDEAGNRLLNLHPQTGALQAVFQLPAVTAFNVSPDGSQLLFAGRERLYFWQQPNSSHFIHGGIVLADPQPQDTAVWQTNTPYSWPISGSYLDLTRRDLQLPGAPRHYRLGVHEGADFYWASGTPVYTVAAGTVVRATLDYERPSEAAFNQRRAQNLALGYTAPDNLDFYRGRQLWILQTDGFIARYAHLGGISEGIVVGTAVTAGQQIGTIGNSGSPLSVNSETADAHLHFELRLDGYYLGQYLRPIETRDLLEQLFTP